LIKTNDADSAIENVLAQLNQMSQHEFHVYQEKNQERKQLQRLLRECFGFQQKEYCDAFRDQNIKMQIVTNERDDLQKRMEVRVM
jgi:hypothetical protein